jgi:phosphatidylethanolamine/phosphatidyl-N-methylethanolamine N-methyltransferase
VHNHRVASASNGVTLVGEIYTSLTPVYDLLFGAVLQPGRKTAIARMALRPGDDVLEVGVGTGINIPLYPAHCNVIGIDISDGMLEVAAERIRRDHLSHARVVRMDAAKMTFADGCFDVVYAPYTISAAPEPVRVAREMRRVCRPGGRIVFLNHFLSSRPLIRGIEQKLTRLTQRIGFRSDVEMYDVLRQAGLMPQSVERVNIPPIWSLVICTRQ